MGKENESGLDFTAQLSQEDIFGKEVPQKDTEKSADVVETTSVSQDELFKSSLEKDDTAGKKEVVKEEGSDKDSPSTPVSETTDLSQSLIFAKYLKEQELLDEFDEAEFTKIFEETKDSAEPLRHIINETFKRKGQQIIDQHDADARGFKHFTELRDKGIDPNEAMTIAYQKTRLDAINDELLEKDQDARKNVLFSLYRETMSLPDDEIYGLINDQISLKKDTDLAKNAVPKLKAILEKKEKDMEQMEVQRRVDEQKQMEASLADLKAKLPDEFLGNKFHAKSKDEIYDMIAKPIVKYKDGTVANAIWADYNKDPNGFMVKVATLMKLGVWDNKADRLKQALKTEVTGDLQRIIQGHSERAQISGKGTVAKEDLPSTKASKTKAEENIELLKKYRYGSL